MTNSIKGMFSHEEQKTTNGGVNQLSATAKLVSQASEIANEILKRMEEDEEKYTPMVEESKESHNAMDNLIDEVYDLETVDIEWLKDESSETLGKMIRSQQSKRSRAKSKQMTYENYLSMLTGAIAENLLRTAADKPKSSGSGGFTGGSVEYTEEELQELSDDQEKLKKAIRNVQSKKSIMKSKADFDPESERWKQLLETEEKLKALRDGGNAAEVKEAMEFKQNTEEMLATVDVNSLKAPDAKKLLSDLQNMLTRGDDSE